MASPAHPSHANEPTERLRADGREHLGRESAQGTSDGLLAHLCVPRTAKIIMLALLLLMMPWVAHRAINDQGSDLPEFVRGGAFILENGYRHPYTALDRYLPSLDVACIPLAMCPLGIAALAYYLFNVGTWFALLRSITTGLLPDDVALQAERGTMAAALLTFVIAADGFLLGAFHVLMVWLMVAGLVHANRERPWRGGTLLGLAIWLKLLPVIGVGYLLIKKKWQAAAIAVLVTVTVDMSLCLAAFGWQGTWHEHLVWARGGAIGTVQEQMQGNSAIDEDRITNQSTIVILRRFLTERGGFPSLAMADLSPVALSTVTGAVLLTLGATLLTAVRRADASTSRCNAGAEIALVVLATVWLSPVVWSYHFTAVLPALAVIMARSESEVRKQVVTAIWILALALFMVPIARAAGHMLWASYLVGGVLLVSMRDGRWLSRGIFAGARSIRLPQRLCQLPSGGLATSGDTGV